MLGIRFPRLLRTIPAARSHRRVNLLSCRAMLRLVVFLAIGLSLVAPAFAVIDILYPLGNLITDADLIVVAKFDKVDPDKPGAVIVVQSSLKGKAPWERLPVNLKGDEPKQSPQLLKRIAAGQPLLIFSLKKMGDEQQLLAYSNGTWFQCVGRADGSETRWAFTHCEPFLRRTYKGATDELQTLIADVLAGKKTAPRPAPKEPPGLGPEVTPAPQEPKK